MAFVAILVGSGALFGAAFAGWYAFWHRQVESSFEPVRVDGRRSQHVLRPDAGAVVDRRR